MESSFLGVVIVLFVFSATSMAFFIMAIIALLKAPKPNLTKGEATFVSLAPHLGFGWLVGLIIYLLRTKKILKDNPELEKAGKKGNILGIVISILFALIFTSILIFQAVQTTSRFHQSQKKNHERQQEYINNESSLKDAKTHPLGKTYNGETFSVEIPCAGNLTEDKNEEAHTNMVSCQNISGKSYIVSETLFPAGYSIDLSNSETVKSILDSGFSSFYSASGITKISETYEDNGTSVFSTGEMTSANQKTFSKFMLKKDSAGKITLYQFHAMGQDVSEQDLRSVIATAQYK